VGDGDRSAGGDLAAEQRHHGAGRAQHVAEPHRDETGGGGVAATGRVSSRSRAEVSAAATSGVASAAPSRPAASAAASGPSASVSGSGVSGSGVGLSASVAGSSPSSRLPGRRSAPSVLPAAASSGPTLPVSSADSGGSLRPANCPAPCTHRRPPRARSDPGSLDHSAPPEQGARPRGSGRRAASGHMVIFR